MLGKRCTFLRWMLFLLLVCPHSLIFAGQITFNYDDSGRITKMSQSDGTYLTELTYTYNEEGDFNAHTTSQMPDSDGDMMPDDWETAFGLNSYDSADAQQDVLDSDGLTNLQEYQIGTDPTLWDSDGDGYSDGAEINAGTNPLDETEFPTTIAAVPVQLWQGLRHWWQF